MNKLCHLQVYILSCLLIQLIFLRSQVYAYGQEIYSENFDNGFQNTWEPRHFIGSDTSTLWKLLNGKYGMKINEVGQSGNSASGNESWTDYAFELDMDIISGMDRNIPFRYQKSPISSTLDKFYELHIAGNGIMLGKAYGSLISPPVGTFNFVYNQTYRWRIEVISNKITVYVKQSDQENFTKVLEHTDNNSPYLSGSIGLRVGAGSAIPSEVYFDNIKVYDLTPEPTPTPTPIPPTPTPTPPPPTPTMTPVPTPTPAVPYYSQQDSRWGGQRYDLINRTIRQVGCALTSAAMVLRYYGLDQLPLGSQWVDLNPGTLNQWLNLPQNQDGWARGGILNWSTLTRLARILNQHDSKYPKLEYEVIGAAQTATIQTLLNQQYHPLILKQSLPGTDHFVVAYSQLSGLPRRFGIHDPWNSAKTVFSPPADVLVRAGHFYPTSSDLSFLYLYADQNLQVTLASASGQINQDLPLSSFDLEAPLANFEDPSDRLVDPYWLLTLKYPASGLYTLNLSTPQTGLYNFEFYLYDQFGEAVKFSRSALVTNIPETFILTYDRDTASSAKIVKVVSFASLRRVIQGTYDLGWLNQKIYAQLIKMANKIELMKSINHSHAYNSLNEIPAYLKHALKQQLVTPAAHGLIVDEVAALKLMLH